MNRSRFESGPSAYQANTFLCVCCCFRLRMREKISWCCKAGHSYRAEGPLALGAVPPCRCVSAGAVCITLRLHNKCTVCANSRLLFFAAVCKRAQAACFFLSSFLSFWKHFCIYAIFSMNLPFQFERRETFYEGRAISDDTWVVKHERIIVSTWYCHIPSKHYSRRAAHIFNRLDYVLSAFWYPDRDPNRGSWQAQDPLLKSGV